MTRPSIEELVTIWETWTAHDPLVRHAWTSTRENHADWQTVLDLLLVRLDGLMDRGSWYTPGVTAAALAGWAVLLALEWGDSPLGEHWSRLCGEVHRAHLQALEARAMAGARSGSAPACPGYGTA